MNKNKQMYLSPETEVLVVRFEDSLLNSGSPNQVRSNSASSGYDYDNDLGDI